MALGRQRAQFAGKAEDVVATLEADAVLDAIRSAQRQHGMRRRVCGSDRMQDVQRRQAVVNTQPLHRHGVVMVDVRGECRHRVRGGHCAEPKHSGTDPAARVTDGVNDEQAIAELAKLEGK